MTTNSRRQRGRAESRQRDLLLAPAPVSGRLGIPVTALAASMRAAGESGPLTEEQARQWKAEPASAPDWLITLWGERLADAAQAHYERKKIAERTAGARIAAEQSARAKVLAGQRDFTEREWRHVREWANDAATILLESGPGDDVSDFDALALQAVGVDARDHDTWTFHLAGCPGYGSGHCVVQIEEAAAARRLERREAALAASAEKEVALGRLGLAPGQAVTAWDGSRVGVVVKLNKVSVKVRLVGGLKDRYAVVERNLDPRHIAPVPATLPPRPDCGARVTLRDHYGHARLATVTRVDGPLFEVSYALASGRQRTGWFDQAALTWC